ncbi:AMP-binding protein [Citricoccus nitrophenolicus]
MANLAAFAADQAQLHGDRPLAIVDGQPVTYAELAEVSARVSGGLAGLGLRPGDRVAVMMSNRLEFLFAWFGILGAGAVEVPIHDAARGDSISYILETTGARILVVDDEHVEHIAPQIATSEALEHVVVVGSTPVLDRPVTVFDALTGHDPLAPIDRGPGDPASILFTGGTTGPPKGAVLSHGHNLNLARNLVELFGYSGEDVLYTAFPLFHANAKYISFLSAMAAGGRIVIDRRFSASNFWATCREHGVTAFAGMGEMLRILLKQEPSEQDRQNSVRLVIGAAAPAEMVEEFEQRYDLTILDVYGLTETGPVAACTPTENRRGACGVATPWYEVRIVDEQDNEVPTGTVGEIAVRPSRPHVMMEEYWGNAPATLATMRNLWFHTGDLAVRDEDGFIWFRERGSDSIRRRGENVSAWEVERVFADHPQLLEAAVYGVPSDLGGQEVVVAAVLRPGVTMDPGELLDYCSGRIAHFAVPRYVRFLAKLPRNHAQRVLKHVLKAEGVERGVAWDRETVGYAVRR